MENGIQPATKADVAAVKADVAAVKADIGSVKADVGSVKEEVAILRAEMNHRYNDLVERIDARETNLLNAFYAFAKSNQDRLTQTERETTAIKDRLATIEGRLMDLERKVNFPNYPPQEH